MQLETAITAILEQAGPLWSLNLEKGRLQAHIARMADQWNEQLRCPQCRKTGMASLSQEDSDDTPTVHSIPDGFKVVTTEFGPDFLCAACDVAAAP